MCLFKHVVKVIAIPQKTLHKLGHSVLNSDHIQFLIWILLGRQLRLFDFFFSRMIIAGKGERRVEQVSYRSGESAAARGRKGLWGKGRRVRIELVNGNLKQIAW